MSISIRDFQELNRTRGERWHKGSLNNWSVMEWTAALAGEAGEACNAAKKLRRLELDLLHRDNRLGSEIFSDDAAHVARTIEMYRVAVAKEAADTIIYGMLIHTRLGVQSDEVLAEVFNLKSKEYGFPELVVLS